MAVLKIDSDFSEDPAGRYYSDGKGSGEEFREEFLLPALKDIQHGSKLRIVIDGEVEAYGSSFLTEGFAGVVKYGYMDKEELKAKIEIHYDDADFKFYKDRILLYISEAKFNSEKYQPTNK